MMPPLRLLTLGAVAFSLLSGCTATPSAAPAAEASPAKSGANVVTDYWACTGVENTLRDLSAEISFERIRVPGKIEEGISLTDKAKESVIKKRVRVGLVEDREVTQDPTLLYAIDNAEKNLARLDDILAKAGRLGLDATIRDLQTLEGLAKAEAQNIKEACRPPARPKPAASLDKKAACAEFNAVRQLLETLVQDVGNGRITSRDEVTKAATLIKDKVEDLAAASTDPAIKLQLGEFSTSTDVALWLLAGDTIKYAQKTASRSTALTSPAEWKETIELSKLCGLT